MKTQNSPVYINHFLANNTCILDMIVQTWFICTLWIERVPRTNAPTLKAVIGYLHAIYCFQNWNLFFIKRHLYDLFQWFSFISSNCWDIRRCVCTVHVLDTTLKYSRSVYIITENVSLRIKKTCKHLDSLTQLLDGCTVNDIWLKTRGLILSCASGVVYQEITPHRKDSRPPIWPLSEQVYNWWEVSNLQGHTKVLAKFYYSKMAENRL